MFKMHNVAIIWLTVDQAAIIVVNPLQQECDAKSLALNTKSFKWDSHDFTTHLNIPK